MSHVQLGSRGTGTRNYLVLLGVSSQAASFVRRLESKFKARWASLKKDFPGCDGVVAVAHSEGGLDSIAEDGTVRPKPNNWRKLVRTLSGFTVHPNVGAVLLVDRGSEQIRISDLVEYCKEEGLPLETVPHAMLTLSDNFENDIEQGQSEVGSLKISLRERHLFPALFSSGMD